MTAHKHASHTPAEPDPDLSPTEYWEQRYSGSGRVWSGKVNETMASIVAELTPGAAIDLGCGEGGDVLWLAEQGWRVTAVDISPTALTRGAQAAAERGVAGRALLQRLAAVRGRLSLCADQAAAAKWWLSMPMASVSAEGPMPKALSTRRTSPLMPGCRHQGRACPLRRARMTSNPLIVA